MQKTPVLFPTGGRTAIPSGRSRQNLSFATVSLDWPSWILLLSACVRGRCISRSLRPSISDGISFHSVWRHFSPEIHKIVSKTESEERKLNKKIGPVTPLNQSLCNIKIKKIFGDTHSHLPHDNIKKLGRLPPESSTRFQAHQPRLFPFSFLFQHKQMYKHTPARFKNVQK